MWLDVHVPPGYAPSDEQGALIVARNDVLGDLVNAYHEAPSGCRTLHGFAASVPNARRFQGRDVAYGITLTNSGLGVIVRHNRHGGAFRALTGDLFIAPTRAPDELGMSLELVARSVPTPAVVAYAVYPAMAGFARSDVVTAEIPGSQDFGAVLLATDPDSADRRDAWRAVSRLLDLLSEAEARHHDLNVKNVLLRLGDDGALAPYVLDVDRVELDWPRDDAFAQNRARLLRSVEKWRDLRGAKVSGEEIERLRRTGPSTR
jgi:hypothetical protein